MRMLGFSVKDARLKAAAPFDPALRDLRLNRAAARFTKATEPARRRRYPSIPRCGISG
jgi:hypothetical protein